MARGAHFLWQYFYNYACLAAAPRKPYPRAAVGCRPKEIKSGKLNPRAAVGRVGEGRGGWPGETNMVVIFDGGEGTE